MLLHLYLSIQDSHIGVSDCGIQQCDSVSLERNQVLCDSNAEALVLSEVER